MRTRVFLFVAVGLFLFQAACGTPKSVPAATAGPSATSTPDLCSAKNLPAAVTPLNDLMRQFDDYASLASTTAQSQLVQVIPPMQAIRRASEDQAIPSCLQDLKKYQLLYMNTTLQTLLAFQSGAKSDVVTAGIAQARQYHDQYTYGLAGLLGLTVTVPPTGTAGAAVPQPTGTAPATFEVVNPGPNPINLRVSASLTSVALGTLEVGQSARVLGKSPTDEWIMIESPTQPGTAVWVYTTLIRLRSGDLAALPVVTATP